MISERNRIEIKKNVRQRYGHGNVSQATMDPVINTTFIRIMYQQKRKILPNQCASVGLYFSHFFIDIFITTWLHCSGLGSPYLKAHLINSVWSLHIFHTFHRGPGNNNKKKKKEITTINKADRLENVRPNVLNTGPHRSTEQVLWRLEKKSNEIGVLVKMRAASAMQVEPYPIEPSSSV